MLTMDRKLCVLSALAQKIADMRAWAHRKQHGATAPR